MSDYKSSVPPQVEQNHNYPQTMNQAAPMELQPQQQQYQGEYQQGEKVIQQQEAPMTTRQGAGNFQSATPLASLGQGPAPVDCPMCGVRQMTRIEAETGNTTLVWGIATCLVCCCLAFIPFTMASLKDQKHSCGHCGAWLATWHKSGRTEVHAHA